MKHVYLLPILVLIALVAGCATQIAQYTPPQKVVVSGALVASHHPTRGTRTVAVPQGEYLRFHEDEKYIYYRQEKVSFVREETEFTSRSKRVRAGGFQLHKKSGNWYIYMMGTFTDMRDDGAPGVCYFTEPKVGDEYVIQEVFIGATGPDGKLDTNQQSEKWGWINHPEKVKFVGSTPLNIK